MSQRSHHTGHSGLKLELKKLMKPKKLRSLSPDSSEMEEEAIFWIETLSVKEIIELVGMFKNEY